MYLLDTNVVSELRKKRCDPKVSAWAFENSGENMFLSVATFYEIRRGICAQERRNPLFAAELMQWINTLRRQFANRILPVSEDVAEEWGKISFLTKNTSTDNLLAATAKIHNLTVATRNIKHFKMTGVACVNPWE